MTNCLRLIKAISNLILILLLLWWCIYLFDNVWPWVYCTTNMWMFFQRLYIMRNTCVYKNIYDVVPPLESIYHQKTLVWKEKFCYWFSRSFILYFVNGRFAKRLLSVARNNLVIIPSFKITHFFPNQWVAKCVGSPPPPNLKFLDIGIQDVSTRIQVALHV